MQALDTGDGREPGEPSDPPVQNSRISSDSSPRFGKPLSPCRPPPLSHALIALGLVKALSSSLPLGLWLHC